MKMKTRLYRTGFFMALALICVGTLKAGIRLPQVLGSHMVIQRDKPVKLWGWADSRERIEVEFNGQLVKTRAGRDGSWSVVLEAMEAGGPYEMVLRGKNELVLEDVLIGDVWICSGQSNMEWPMEKTRDAEAEMMAADWPGIRLLTVPKNIQTSAVENILETEWVVCSPELVSDFSAVAYFFGRQMHKETGVPVGLIGSYWGGTNVETWISAGMSGTDPEMAEAIKGLDASSVEEMRAKLKAERRAVLDSLGKVESGMVDGLALWAAPDLDLSEWNRMELPGIWEDRGLRAFDGVVWFRRDVELTAEQAQNPAILHLGAIDDSDQVWVNGVPAGETRNRYNLDRVYRLAEGLLVPGKNSIVVRVEDTGGAGGFSGEADELFIQCGPVSVPLAGEWSYRVSAESLEINAQLLLNPNRKPTLLYNGMIHPLINFSARGFIWYQGESNASRADRYAKLFPMLIRDWRNKWQDPDMGFYFVQLANYMAADELPVESEWAELRESQTRTLALPHTGMAVTIDIGEADDIHPRNKQDVGYRLSLLALHDSYGRDLVYSGPVFESFKLEGPVVRVKMDPGASRLEVRDKYGYVKGFAIAGEDREFHWAQGVLVDGEILLQSPQVQKPVAVRYAWGNNPDDANLYNAEGLPAVPFRSDKWPGLTFGK